MDICHLEKADLEAPKIQRSRWHCERRFRVLCSIHRTRIISITNDGSKSWISYPDCQVAMDKQLTQYPLIPKENGRCSTNYWKFQIRSVQTFGFVYDDTNGQNHGPVWKIQSFLNEICMGIFWQDSWERQFKKILLKDGWEKVSKLGMFIVQHQQGLFLSVYVDDMKLAGKKQNIDPMMKLHNKEVDLWETTSFFDHVYLRCIQRQCEISTYIVDNYRAMFESRISAGENIKASILWESSYFFMVLWHGWSCKEMCGAMLTLESIDFIYSSYVWIHTVSPCG